MLEAVYVLPVIVFVIMALLETVNYAADSLVWNENMNNLYQQVMTDADQGNTNVFKSATGMLVCTNGAVQPSADAASQMQQRLFDWFKAKYDLTGKTVPIAASNITVISKLVTNAMGESFFVVKASYPMKSLVLPELKSLFGQISVSGSSIYMIQFKCRSA